MVIWIPPSGNFLDELRCHVRVGNPKVGRQLMTSIDRGQYPKRIVRDDEYSLNGLSPKPSGYLK
jgi:hypothetical protein